MTRFRAWPCAGPGARKGLTQKELAERTGIPQRHISEMENGPPRHRQGPGQASGRGAFHQLEGVSGLAKLLGISRPTLIAKIEKYGLKIETQVS